MIRTTEPQSSEVLSLEPGFHPGHWEDLCSEAEVNWAHGGDWWGLEEGWYWLEWHLAHSLVLPPDLEIPEHHSQWDWTIWREVRTVEAIFCTTCYSFFHITTPDELENIWRRFLDKARVCWSLIQLLYWQCSLGQLLRIKCLCQSYHFLLPITEKSIQLWVRKKHTDIHLCTHTL